MSAFAERACQGMMIVLNDDLTRNTLNWYVQNAAELWVLVLGSGLRGHPSWCLVRTVLFPSSIIIISQSEMVLVTGVPFTSPMCLP